MRTIQFFLVGAVCALLLVGTAVSPAAAQVSNTTTAGIWATIIKALTVTKTDDLRFGQIAPAAQACTIKLSPQGTRTVVAGDCMPTLGGDVVGPARFVVDGAAGEHFKISFGGTGLLSNGTAHMTISDYETDAGPTPTLDSSGRAEFAVGATLTLAAGQPQGLYEGDFIVMVEYE